MPDPVTHLSVGYVVARHLFRKHKPLFLFSTMAPDIDGFVGLVYIMIVYPMDTPRAELKAVFEIFHPSLPASLFFLPLFGLIILAIALRIRPTSVPVQRSNAFLLVVTAILVHLGLDMLMTGNRPFWPLKIEAGLPVIPYTSLGSLLTVSIALLILFLDLVIFRKRDRNQR